MKKASLIISLGLIAVLPALAQENKDAKKWDISKLDAGKLPPAASQKGVTFAKDIQPLFKASCERCHGEEQQKGGLRLDSLEATMKGGKAGKMVTAGDSAKSLIVLAVCQQDDGTAMPPKHRGRPGGPGGPANAPGGAGRGPGGPDGQGVAGPGGQVAPNAPAGGPGPGGRGPGGPPPKPLTPEQVALVRAWIDQGAK